GSADRERVRAAMAGHLCRCTGYHQILDAICLAAGGQSKPADAPQPRPDLPAKLDGTAIYPTDVAVGPQDLPPVLWTEEVSAGIDGIDPAAARGVPGVVRILTVADIPGENLGAENTFGNDQPLLADKRVRCRGDALAVVVGASDAAARAGLER